jgi:hypothetical protein
MILQEAKATGIKNQTRVSIITAPHRYATALIGQKIILMPVLMADVTSAFIEPRYVNRGTAFPC